jgi:hypothetical protein
MSKKPIIAYVLSVIITLLCFAASKGNCQTSTTPSVDTPTQEEFSIAWLKDLYEPGVMMQADSLVINKEAEHLLNDAGYRQTMYPATYTWEAAASFIQKQEIKKAVWYFINLYLKNDENKEMVIKSLLVYDKVFKMEKVLMSSFYTYSFTDPEIGKIENGHSEINAPHIMEKKLNALKAMLYYLNKYKSKDRIEETKKD